MPVGQAVTATRDLSVAGALTGALTGAAAGESPTAPWTRSTTSWAEVAPRRLSVKSRLTSARASLVSSWRCVASPPAGAAIRNARSAGPSLAPNSTFGDSRAKARVGSSTAVVRQWGMAMPPGSPVGAVPSRAIASSASWSGYDARPASATRWARARMTSCFSPPMSSSSRTRAVVIRSDMSLSNGWIEAGDMDEVRAYLLRVGDGRAGKSGGRASVGDGERESLGGVTSGDVPEEVAEEAGVAGPDRADDGGGGRGRVPGALGADQDGAVRTERHQHRLDAALHQVAGRDGCGDRVGLERVGVVPGERRELLAVRLHQVRSGLGHGLDEGLQRCVAGVHRDVRTGRAQGGDQLGVPLGERARGQ